MLSRKCVCLGVVVESVFLTKATRKIFFKSKKREGGKMRGNSASHENFIAW